MNEWKTWEDRCLELLDEIELCQRDTARLANRVLDATSELRELITSSPEDARMRMVKPR